ncbi:hypothetical protein CB0940_08066 [Cercospora beticola]|uniref:BTB domain-containing protein n=2 Tax=Cercospora beticola TaxID=122368 RepID=A0A2G5HNM4_CERBT|nr:hypothetical protein CB0940_08066 [Cercospora beticola]PIA94118.1 hypothetical protein CB0940_08066 [Cercospora beticola]
MPSLPFVTSLGLHKAPPCAAVQPSPRANIVALLYSRISTLWHYQNSGSRDMVESIGATPGEIPVACKPMVNRVMQLFQSAKYSDLKVTCNDFTWDVHRAIVCPAAEYFRSRCEYTPVGQLDTIKLLDDNVKIVYAMFQYIYTADYNDDFAPEIPPVLFNVHVHNMGSKYGVLHLCKLAEAKFTKVAMKEWESEDFVKAIAEMYTTEPESKQVLQKTAAKIVARRAKLLLKAEDSMFAELSREIGLFAHDVAMQLMGTTFPERDNELRYECPSCKKTFVREKLPAHGKDSGEVYGWCPFGCGHDYVENFNVVDEY